MMYGRTSYNPLSRFIRDEIPSSLIEEEGPRREPPRGRVTGYSDFRREANTDAARGFSKNTRREAPTFPRRGAEGYGIKAFSPGTRVTHAMFGAGTVVSARDMGGDVLYEVKFDTGSSKKLMATYAKLTKL
jgi:DNA helicase-2/ATP-dependent DNA helicase PcrA